MTQPYDIFTHANHQIEIYPDEDAQNPRAGGDMFGTIIAFESRSRESLPIGPDDKLILYEESTKEALMEALKPFEGGHYLIIKAYIHSGWTISASPTTYERYPDQEWDVSQVGFICCSKEQIIDNYGDDSLENRQKAEKILLAEIEELDQYLTGDVWGYIIKTPLGEEVAAWWGHFGLDYCHEEALSSAEGLDAYKQIAADTRSIDIV